MFITDRLTIVVSATIGRTNATVPSVIAGTQGEKGDNR